MTAPLDLSRSRILAFRRRANGLDERAPRGRRALRRIARAGLQDSMPRAALLSIHARMDGTTAETWEDPALVQTWGPRYSAYVVARQDLALFTLARLPEDDAGRERARNIAARLRTLLGDDRMAYGAAARALGEKHANRLRYAAPTGTVLMRWDGARQPEIWTVPPPDVDPKTARLELARRYLQVFGPSTPQAFTEWAGLRGRHGGTTFDALGNALIPVRTPIGEAWILAADEPAFRSADRGAAPARLLPSGDTYYLLQGRQRELLVAHAKRRAALWTSRVWPGAVLADGAIVGTWRRAEHRVTVQPWGRLTAGQRDAIETEAAALPLPGLDGKITVRWERGWL